MAIEYSGQLSIIERYIAIEQPFKTKPPHAMTEFVQEYRP